VGIPRQARAPATRKTDLHVFDFDGTLFRSPGPPPGTPREEQDAFWHDPSSLRGELVPAEPNENWYVENVVEAFRRARKNPANVVVVMTGRSEPLRRRVREILQKAGLHPDEIVLKSREDTTTREYKLKEMRRLLDDHPDVKKVHFWEDRKGHLRDFQEDTERRGYRFVPHHVEDAPSSETWKEFMGLFYDGGALQVPNPDESTRAQHPTIRADHLMKTNTEFRESVHGRFSRWMSMGRPRGKKAEVAAKIAATWLLRLAYEFSLDEAYKFMGLGPSATTDDVKAAYRHLALKFHPDRGGDPEEMKKLNAAREVIESGGAVRRPSSPEATERDESSWQRYRARHGPQPSGNHGDSDLRNLAQDVLDKNLRQIVFRGKVPSVPVDAGVPQGGRWTYHRPFGSKIRTQRLPDDVDADKLYQAIRSFGKGSIFDVVVKDKEAWVTWEHPDGKFQSLSFEEVKAKSKKPPGVGMKPEDARQRMRAGGLDLVAGGTKYGYWGPRGHREKTGYFIREAAKTLRLVRRVKTGDYRGIQDAPVANEVYFGQLRPEQLDEWIEYVKRKAAG